MAKSEKRISNAPFYITLLLSITLLPASLNLTAQNPYIHQYTTNDGLPSNTVYYVYQDSKKFIWFATDAGVARFDGTTFTNYRKKDGLISNKVIRIKEDSYGRVWFFNYDGSLNYFYHNHF
jgi:ligand-binding sensor domain-containing protein